MTSFTQEAGTDWGTDLLCVLVEDIPFQETTQGDFFGGGYYFQENQQS